MKLNRRKVSDGVVNSCTVGLILLDNQRKILLWNHWIAVASGIKQEDAIGKTLKEVFFEQIDADVLTAVEEAFEIGVSSILSQALHKWPLPLYVRKSDIATPMDQLIHVTLVDTHGSEHSCLIQITDVTATIRRENLLREQTNVVRKALHAAEQASQAKSHFLSSMSHELRTPLNAIIGFSELLMLYRDTISSDECNEEIQEIHKAGLHMLDLVNDLLDLSKIEASMLDMYFEHVNVQEIIKEVISLCAASASAMNVQIVNRMNADFGAQQIYADRRRLKQVLLNLVSNAVKYNTRGGSVAISGELRQPNALAVLIADTGVGISSEEIDKVFEPFYRVRSDATQNIDGAGIGLSISKRLIEQMGGTMGAESAPNSGSTFWISLPIKNVVELADMGASAAQPEPIGPLSDNPDKMIEATKIILAEDNLVNQKVISNMLKRSGYEVHIANNGLELLQMLESDSYGLVLMDLEMPVMNGYEAAIAIRKNENETACARIPIICLTANAMDGVKEKCIAIGMDGFITKPVSFQILGEAVRAGLNI